MIAATNDHGCSFDEEPVRSYFEVNGINDENMIIELKSDTDSVIYDGVSGDTLENSSSLVIPGAPLVTGSVVKVIIWTMVTNEGDIQSLCQFETDGKMISSRSLILNGSDIVPTIYVNEMFFCLGWSYENL